MIINKFKAIFILGGPGSGKGTQSQLISQKYQYKHMSAGQLLRNEKKKLNSNYKQIIQNTINTGAIIPSYVTIQLLLNEILKDQGKTKKFIIDGFPRNLENLKMWNQQTSNLVEISFVISLICSEQQMLKRLLKRSQIDNRSDDKEQIIKKRFSTYNNSTLKVIEYFKNQNKLKQIDANGRQEDIFLRISKIFEQMKING